MDNWVFNSILDIAANSHNAAFVLAIADLLVHTFLKIAFGLNIRPGVYRRFGGGR